MSEETDKNKRITVWKTMSTRMLIRRIAFTGGMAACFYAGIAYCADFSPAIDAAERVDKMTSTGILALGFILMSIANLYLIKLVFGQLKDVVERAVVVMTKVDDAMRECKKS